MVMLGNGVATTDTDPVETHEWRDALDSVLDVEGPERVAGVPLVHTRPVTRPSLAVAAQRGDTAATCSRSATNAVT